MRRPKTVLFLIVLLTVTVGLMPIVTAEKTQKIDVSVMMPHFGGIPTDKPVHQQWEKLMNKLLDVDINFTWSFIPWGEFAEKTNLAMASGDLPDLMYVPTADATIPYEDQDIFVELSEYEEIMPNYIKFVDSIHYGRSKIENADGHYYGFRNVEIPRLEQGLGIYSVSAYRYDVFEDQGIKIPETTEEFYQAAKQLRTLFPDKYPVAYANWHGVFKTAGGIFWNGNEFVYGPITDGYRDMLAFANKLYSEYLIDPESFTYDNDTRTMRALNGSNYMQMSIWFNYVVDWNNNEEADGVWVNALYPSDEKYGVAWQNVVNVNEPTLGSHMLTINADADNRELLIKMCDLQFTDEVIELVTWGIEGDSFVRDEKGNPTFIDQIKNAANPWTEGDNWGMRASSQYRPGLQLAIDTKAFLDFAPKEASYIDGKYIEISWEEAFPEYSWPDSELIPTNVFAPPVSFTTDESQDNATIMTVANTIVDETKLKFIRGELSVENDWDSYVKNIEDTNIQKVLDLYNEKAALITQ